MNQYDGNPPNNGYDNNGNDDSDNESEVSIGRDLASGTPEKQEYWLAPNVFFLTAVLIMIVPIGRTFSKGQHSLLPSIISIKGRFVIAAIITPSTLPLFGVVAFTGECSTFGNVTGVNSNELNSSIIGPHLCRIAWTILETTWRRPSEEGVQPCVT
jgi:hypothetical protein